MESVANIFHKFLSDLSPQSKSALKKPLFHYTDSNGLAGILKTKSIFLTEYSFLNDPNEMIHGIGITRVRLWEEIISIFNKKPDMNSDTIALLKKIEKRAEELDKSLSAKYFFIFSFCEDSDLLSQWKGYSNLGEGFSIGFDAISLSVINEASLVKIVYDDQKKKELLNRFVTMFLENKELIDFKNEESYLELFLAIISLFAISFKNDYFQNENEWRLVYSEHLTNKITNKKTIQYLPKKLGIVPYVEVPLSEDYSEIKEIKTGPKINYEINKKALYSLLDQKKCEITHSKIILQ